MDNGNGKTNKLNYFPVYTRIICMELFDKRWKRKEEINYQTEKESSNIEYNVAEFSQI